MPPRPCTLLRFPFGGAIGDPALSFDIPPIIRRRAVALTVLGPLELAFLVDAALELVGEIGRASCRERV